MLGNRLQENLEYRLNAAERSTAKGLIRDFVVGVLERNSNRNFDKETRKIYHLLGNYVNGFQDEETVYREITAQFKNRVIDLGGESKSRVKSLEEKAPYIIAASAISLFVPSLAPIALMAFILGSTALMEKSREYKAQRTEATEKYNLVEFLGSRQGARTVKSLKSIILEG